MASAAEVRELAAVESGAADLEAEGLAAEGLAAADLVAEGMAAVATVMDMAGGLAGLMGMVIRAAAILQPGGYSGPPAGTNGPITAAAAGSIGAAAAANRPHRKLFGQRPRGRLHRRRPRTARRRESIEQHAADPGLAQEYESILTLLKDLDVPPRQVLIEAKIYSVDLTHAFSSSVSATLQQITGHTPHTFLGSLVGATTNLSGRDSGGKEPRASGRSAVTGIGEPRQGAFGAGGDRHRQHPCLNQCRNVVPTLTAQAVTGVQSRRQFAVCKLDFAT